MPKGVIISISSSRSQHIGSDHTIGLKCHRSMKHVGSMHPEAAWWWPKWGWGCLKNGVGKGHPFLKEHSEAAAPAVWTVRSSQKRSTTCRRDASCFWPLTHWGWSVWMLSFAPFPGTPFCGTAGATCICSVTAAIESQEARLCDFTDNHSKKSRNLFFFFWGFCVVSRIRY